MARFDQPPVWGRRHRSLPVSGQPELSRPGGSDRAGPEGPGHCGADTRSCVNRPHRSDMDAEPAHSPGGSTFRLHTLHIPIYDLLRHVRLYDLLYCRTGCFLLVQFWSFGAIQYVLQSKAPRTGDQTQRYNLPGCCTIARIVLSLVKVLHHIYFIVIYRSH